MTWDLDMCLSDFVINLEPRRKNYNKVTISSSSKDAGKYLKANQKSRPKQIGFSIAYIVLYAIPHRQEPQCFKTPQNLLMKAGGMLSAWKLLPRASLCHESLIVVSQLKSNSSLEGEVLTGKPKLLPTIQPSTDLTQARISINGSE